MPFTYFYDYVTIIDMATSQRKVSGNVTWSSICTGSGNQFQPSDTTLSMKTSKYSAGRTWWRENSRIHVEFAFEKQSGLGAFEHVPVHALLESITFNLYRTVTALFPDNAAKIYRVYQGTWTTPMTAFNNPYNQFSSTVYSDFVSTELGPPFNAGAPFWFKFALDNDHKLLEYCENQLHADESIKLVFRTRSDYDQIEPTGVNRQDWAGHAHLWQNTDVLRPKWTAQLQLPTTPQFGSTF